MKNRRLLVCVFVLVVLLCNVGCSGENIVEYNKTKYTTELKTKSIDALQSCYYGGSSEIVYEKPTDVIEFLNQQESCEAVTIPIAWSFVESEEGKWDFSLYEPIFNEIIKNDYKIIIILDAGGRSILKNGEVVTKSIPDWVWLKYPNTAAIDFEGNKTSTFDYFSTEQLDVVCDFYNKTIEWLEKYRGDIVAISPGIMGECEIKYSQEGFRWQSYSKAASVAFRKFLAEKYETVLAMNDEFGVSYSSFEEIELPIINYNNTIVAPNSAESFLYTEWMQCRERQIVKYTTIFTDIIHDYGYKTIGYFGQFMYPIDAIYATGVVAECTEIFDIAVIDYNFYDGYKTVYNEYIPAYLTNLVSNLGYETVYTGLYFERMSLDGQQDFVSNVTNYIQEDGHSSGIETGSVTNNTSEKILFDMPKNKKIEKSKVAIYTSEWNYYKTHGESEQYQDYLSDSVIELYRILQFDLGIPVEVITDINVQNGELKNYELVFAPCQMFVADEEKTMFKDYVSSGGKLIQDIRFGEYDSYGRVDDSINEIFGIARQQAQVGNALIRSKDSGADSLNIRIIYENIPSYYTYVNVGQSQYLLETKKEQFVGILTENTLTWGFQPQLQYQKSNDERYLKYIINSVNLLTE